MRPRATASSRIEKSGKGQRKTHREPGVREGASLRDKERKLAEELEESWRDEENEQQPEIGEEEIADIVSM
jgi:hypothetical protein